MSAIEDQSQLMGETACQLLLQQVKGDTKVYKKIVPQRIVIRDTSAKNHL
jgi:LacI family transcriptional regulator